MYYTSLYVLHILVCTTHPCMYYTSLYVLHILVWAGYTQGPLSMHWAHLTAYSSCLPLGGFVSQTHAVALTCDKDAVQEVLAVV